MLISPEYKRQNQALHSAGGYGTKGHSFVEHIVCVCAAEKTRDVLDYGCGQGSLQKALSFPIRQYDPCIPGFDTPPEPADVVACTDVLEHIEPECLDAVLDDLKRLVKRVGFFAVDTRPALKHLPDGRNAHLIQKRAEWWFPKFYERWSVVQVGDILYRPEKSLGFTVVVKEPRSVQTINEGRS